MRSSRRYVLLQSVNVIAWRTIQSSALREDNCQSMIHTPNYIKRESAFESFRLRHIATIHRVKRQVKKAQEEVEKLSLFREQLN